MSLSIKGISFTILFVNLFCFYLGLKNHFVHNKVNWRKLDFVSAMKLDLSESIRETHFGLLKLAKELNGKTLYYPSPDPVRLERSDLPPVTFFFRNFSNVEIKDSQIQTLADFKPEDFAGSILKIHRPGDYSPLYYISSRETIYKTYTWQDVTILAPEGAFK